ncbi:MAG TPA: hypothetical protein VHW23_14560 [Kofleriaceae bacterium]|nr:hypothetical protein [Kofleriaceae bacterium]
MKPITTFLIGLGLGLAAPAHADISAAARAFSDAQAAQLEGNYERAAQSYELAFHIAPSKEALRSAVRARQLANQLPRAAMLAQVLLEQYGDDDPSARLAAEVLAEARNKLGRIAVNCSQPCTLALGGRAISLNPAPKQVVFATPGRQVLEITFDGDRSVTRELPLKPGDDVALPIEPPAMKRMPPSAAPPASPAPPAPPAGHVLSPYWAVGGAAATVLLAGITTWSGIDTNRAHDAYVKTPTDQGWDDGQAKQLRTNLLLGTTIATGVATALVAVLWTRWSDPVAQHEVAITPSSGGATLSFGGRF